MDEKNQTANSAPNESQKRRSSLARFLLLAVALAAAVAVGAALDGKRPGGLDGLRRMLTYREDEAGMDGRVELFRFDSDRTAQYGMLGSSLLIVSAMRIQLIGENGNELFTQSVSFTNPAISIGGSTAAVYNVGGKELYLFSRSGLLRDMSAETGNGILSASLNASDYLALTTLKSGYRSAVTAYNPSGAPVFTLNSAERYVSDACVLNDNRLLAAVTLGESDGTFASIVSFYPMDEESASATVALSGTMALALRTFGANLSVIGEDSVSMLQPEGEISGTYRYEYPYLRGQSFGSDFTALLLSRYRSGSTHRIVTVSEAGEVLSRLDQRRDILDISAAGHYIAVLYTDSLTVFTSDLTEYAALEETDYAKKAVMRADGSVVLIGSTGAWLFVP